MVRCHSGICVDWYNARTLDDGIRYYKVGGHGSVLIMKVLAGIEMVGGIMNLVTRYLQWLKEHGLDTYAYPPLSDDEITAFETAQGVALPAALRELYLHLGGQESEILNQTPYRLIPLAEIVTVQARLLAQVQRAFGENWADFRLDDFEDGDMVRNLLFHDKRLPIFQNDNDDYYCLDFAPAEAGRAGQVIAVRGESDGEGTDLLLMFDTFDACLEDIIEDLDNEAMQDMESFFAHTGETLQALGEHLDELDTADLYDAEIGAHIERTLGAIDGVLHDMTPGALRVHVYHVAADAGRPFQLLITSGMSSLPMTFPEDGYEALRRAELLVMLPPDWNVRAQEDVSTWPMQWLKILARLPHEQHTWLGCGHTITFSEDATATLPGTPFNSLLVLPPRTLPEDFVRLQTADGEVINFYALVPLYPAEFALKERNGLEALLARFNASHIMECVDLSRMDCAAS